MAKHKVLTHGIANLGDVVRAIVSGRANVQATVKFANGQILPSDISILKMELAFDKSQVRYLAQSESFDDVQTPPEEGIILVTSGLPSIDVE